MGDSECSQITASVKALARELGFDLVGISSAEPFTERGQTALQRVQKGLIDGLPWFTKERVSRGTDPRNILPTARSIVSLALNYYTPTSRENRQGGSPPWNPQSRGEQARAFGLGLLSPTEGSPRGEPLGGRPLRGRVARYAWGEDYHKVFERKVELFLERLPGVVGRPVTAKWYTDTGPLLDRAVAERAGVGWFGKSTNVLTSIGSWVLLAEVITDLELEPGRPLRKTCGRCRICMDACPTGAIVAPYTLDNTRCISYQTIENRGVIPQEIRPLIGDWVFGCDVCQDVCPVNRKAQLAQEYALFARDGDRARPELLGLLDLTEAEFQERYRGSAMRRAKLPGLKRNACVALGNIGDQRAIPSLARVLRESRESGLVRAHAAWALGRLGGAEAEAALRRALVTEQDEGVREEILLAFGEFQTAATVKG